MSQKQVSGFVVPLVNCKAWPKTGMHDLLLGSGCNSYILLLPQVSGHWSVLWNTYHTWHALGNKQTNVPQGENPWCIRCSGYCSAQNRVEDIWIPLNNNLRYSLIHFSSLGFCTNYEGLINVTCTVLWIFSTMKKGITGNELLWCMRWFASIKVSTDNTMCCFWNKP